MKKLIVDLENQNGVLVDLTAEEITQRETEIAEATAKQQELDVLEETKAQTQADLKASAKQKLMNGEALTEDEANVMVGL